MLNELQNFMLENGIAVFWGFFHADILLQMCGVFFLIYLNRRLIQISYLIFSVPTGIQFLFICNLITVVGSTLYKKYCNFLLFTLRIKYFIGKKAYNENQFFKYFCLNVSVYIKKNLHTELSWHLDYLPYQPP